MGEHCQINFKNYSAAILAGGKGTRIKALFPELPKPLIEFNGKPVLFWQIDSLLDLGIEKIFILAGYKAEIIKQRVNQCYDDKVVVIIEETPLDTFGCLSLVKNKVDRKYLIFLSGDLIFNINFNKFCLYHEQKNSECTLTVHSNFHPLDADLIDYNEQTGKINELIVRPHPNEMLFLNNVNAAVSILNTELISDVQDKFPQNFEKDFLPSLLQKERAIFAYKSIDYIRDIGTPERYNQAVNDLKNYFSDKLDFLESRKLVFFDILNFYRNLMENNQEKILHFMNILDLCSKPNNLLIGYCIKDSNARRIVETFLGKNKAKFDLVYEYSTTFENELSGFAKKFDISIQESNYKFAFKD
ncbi:NDP-sugar synthase [Pigmentibacter sp. JX0631]|uniref:nucleotidyltransferase family protein n=1 Tax=Pigmentibacter sp. JX0631 TaxID=2976982 RepID=UPI0024698C3E|nr:NDP-sugar synthase [Pigmentibacter sp. JX0631]WGL60842.1 NDP-sugar synthase [Pigmentibacter sp. JX0631]